MNACRQRLSEMFDAVLSSPDVVGGQRVSVVVTYVAERDVLVDREAVVGATHEADTDAVAVDRLETVQSNAPTRHTASGVTDQLLGAL